MIIDIVDIVVASLVITILLYLLIKTLESSFKFLLYLTLISLVILFVFLYYNQKHKNNEWVFDTSITPAELNESVMDVIDALSNLKKSDIVKLLHHLSSDDP